MQNHTRPPERPLFLAPDLPEPVPEDAMPDFMPEPLAEAAADAHSTLVISGQEACDGVDELIGQAITERKARGLTQYDIRDLTGIPQGRVSSLERREHMPLADSLVRYLAGIGGRLVVVFDPPEADPSPTEK